MPVSGLLALLDDVSSMLDDGSTLDQLATEKASKIAEDDLTSKVKHHQKIDTKHEISVILAVAKGALKNKILYFIPSTFAIAVFAPWAIIPLTLGAGAYIAHEGVKKILEKNDPKADDKRRQELLKAARGGKETLLKYENERIAQAIKTDAALSLELTGFQLGMVVGAPILTKLAVLGMASVGATTLLYMTIIGVIGMNGIARILADKKGGDWFSKQQRKTGKVLMKLSSPVMKTIGFAGMSALFYVGGHLLSAHMPGSEYVLKSIGEMVSNNPLVQQGVEILATIATGIAGGLATFGAVKALEKPVGAAKNKAKAVYAKHLSTPLIKVKSGFKNAMEFTFGVSYSKSGEPPHTPLMPALAVTPETNPSAEIASGITQQFAASAERISTPIPIEHPLRAVSKTGDGYRFAFQEAALQPESVAQERNIAPEARTANSADTKITSSKIITPPPDAPPHQGV